MENQRKGCGSLANTIELLLSVLSKDDLHGPAEKLRNFLKDKEYVHAGTVDIFLQNFLLNVLPMEEGKQKPNASVLSSGWTSPEERQQVFLDFADSLCFGNNIKLSQVVLARALHLDDEEDEARVLIFFAQKHHQLRTMPKFMTNLLKAAKDGGALRKRLNPKLAVRLGEWVTKLPISQNVSMWSPLCQAVDEDAAVFSTKPDTENFAQTALAADFLSVLLLNICLADYSIRDDTLKEVVNSFKLVTGKLSLLTTQANVSPKNFLQPLLSLACAYGELHHLLLLYSQPYVELQPPKTEEGSGQKDDESIFDLSYFHTYADSDQWVRFGEQNSADMTPQWAALFLQKIRHLVVFAGRHKQDKVVRKLLAWLVDHYDTGLETLWIDNFKYLLPLMTPRQLETLGQKFVASEAWSKSVLHDSDLMDKRSFQMTVMCSVFRWIYDHCRKRKSSDDSPLLPSSTLSVLKKLSLQADVWIGAVDRTVKEVPGWLRESASTIKDSMTQTLPASKISESDLTELFHPLELMERLPLEFLTGPVHSAALMGLLSLLLSCGSFEQHRSLKERLLVMIVRLLDNPEKLSSLYDYLPSADVLTWAVSYTQDLPSSTAGLVFSALFDEVLRSPQGLKDASTWIESTGLTSSSLSVAVLAMKKLAGNQKPTAVKMFSSLMDHFLKGFEAAMEDSQQVADVLQGAHCLIQVYVERKRPSDAKKSTEQSKTPSEEQKILEMEPLLAKLDKLVEKSWKAILSSADDQLGTISADFLYFIFVNQKILTDHLPASTRVSVWTAYRLSPYASRWEDRLLRLLLAKASKKELIVMINAILDDLQTVSSKLDEEESEAKKEEGGRELLRVCCFFRHLVAVELPTQDDRHGIRLQAIQTALPLVQHLILSQCRRVDRPTYHDDVVRLALPCVSIYLALLNLGPSYAYPHDVASALHACLALPLDGPSVLAMGHEHFEAIFTAAYKVLHYLLVKFEEIAADRIPVLFQVYRRLLASTCARADQRRLCPSDGSTTTSTTSVELSGLADCANRLSRLASMINGQRLRYRRTATYVVADLMDEFKKRPVHPTVKQELTPALHHLMDLLDQHASRYLLAVLPAGLRELFRLELDQFTKFYKFKGKV